MSKGLNTQNNKFFPCLIFLFNTLSENNRCNFLRRFINQINCDNHITVLARGSFRRSFLETHTSARLT